MYVVERGWGAPVGSPRVQKKAVKMTAHGGAEEERMRIIHVDRVAVCGVVNTTPAMPSGIVTAQTSLCESMKAEKEEGLSRHK